MAHSLSGSQQLGLDSRLTKLGGSVWGTAILVPSSAAANNGVAAGCQRSVSRHGLLGFQLAIRSFPATRYRPAIIVLRCRSPTAPWQSQVGRIVTGDHPFI